MKKWLIQYYVVLSILLGGCFQLYARTHEVLITPLSKASLEILDEAQPTNKENSKHQNRSFVVANFFSSSFFIKTLLEVTDTEEESDEDEKEEKNSKLKKLAAKKVIPKDFASYNIILFYSKSLKAQRLSLYKKTALASSSFCSFSSDNRLYIVFENFRI
ncbi:MAG: hypothetical protein DCF13_09215 [Flavobacteriaceae bacterium]|nr:MAG: hypothetical protein DCF13_09215 [Flavobacteriaceae bacterium]